MANKTEAQKQIDKAKRESLEQEFLTQWRRLGGPELVPEFKFNPERKFRFDYARPELKIAIELEGGVWLDKGAHTTGKGYAKDCVKYNLANLAGWRLFRFTSDMLATDPAGHLGPVIELIRESANA